MAKKDKTVEVTVKDTMRDQQPIQEVSIGKNVIGEIRPEGDRFIASVDGGESFRARSQEEGLELVLEEYHLHQG
ncbi:hypothetical protein LOOC260_115880 [Paucilactobacillus hokkaidonensis JCM 18461]|uniref:DUF2969 domain-containing protein n=2 Tax=Paucilactobacillus hokkaidonensis TaxID=1193095 RepID=A0A0A1GYN3_9LACO|nr:DUF2969 domain-containing protein [Paucilactobacillus hokkaidonensis]KRO10579.1 hypothetical protein IV59_GL001678 [Paucilactobacillus hokkaidonensis]BAP86098.1 hypothetical protein LOOC260_115880 [Paucilactobacillus hokkaidonensis JCM 18461]